MLTIFVRWQIPTLNRFIISGNNNSNTDITLVSYNRESNTGLSGYGTVLYNNWTVNVELFQELVTL